MLVVTGLPAWSADSVLDEDPACQASPDGGIVAYPSRLALSEHLAADTDIPPEIHTDRVLGLRLASGKVFHGEGPGGFVSGATSLSVGDGPYAANPGLARLVAAEPGATLDVFAPSQEGTKLAFVTHRGGWPRRHGPEDDIVHVVDVTTRQESTEVVHGMDRGALSWLPGGTGFFYSRASDPVPDTRPLPNPASHLIELHVIGTGQDADVPLVGTGVRGSPAMAAADFPMMFTTPGSQFVVLAIFHASDRWARFFIAPLQAARQPRAPWRQFADVADGVTDVALHGNRLFLLSHGDEPESHVLELDARAPKLRHAKIVVPEGPRVIRRLMMASDALYTLEHCVTKGRIRRLDLADHSLRDLGLPMSGYIEAAQSDPATSGVVFAEDSRTVLAHWYRSVNGEALPSVELPSSPAAASRSASSHHSTSTGKWPRPRWGRRKR